MPTRGLISGAGPVRPGEQPWYLETRSGTTWLVFPARLTISQATALAGLLLAELPRLDEFVLRAGGGAGPHPIIYDRYAFWSARRLRPELRVLFGPVSQESS